MRNDEDLLKDIASCVYEEDDIYIPLRGTVEKVECGYWVEARVWVGEEMVLSEQQALSNT